MHGMRIMSHKRGNPETDVCRNLNMHYPSSTLLEEDPGAPGLGPRAGGRHAGSGERGRRGHDRLDVPQREHVERRDGRSGVNANLVNSGCVGSFSEVVTGTGRALRMEHRDVAQSCDVGLGRLPGIDPRAGGVVTND